MRGFHADGTERFADRSVHDDNLGTRVVPAIGLDSLGNIVVVWQDDSDGNGAFQIRAGSYAAVGTSTVAEWTVNRDPSGQQLFPGAALGASGALIIAWEDDMDGNGFYQVVARGY